MLPSESLSADLSPFRFSPGTQDAAGQLAAQDSGDCLGQIVARSEEMKFGTTVAVIAVCSFAVSGCQSNPERQARLAAAERNAPVCTDEKECEAMWSSARRWVLVKWCNHLNDIKGEIYEIIY